MLTSTPDADDALRSRREAMSRKLLPVMEEMLDEESFTEISVERLVNEAGVSRSSFYNHFEDKGDLLRLMTEDVMSSLFGVARGWWDLPPQATRDEVRASLREIADAYLPHSKLMASVVEAASYDEAVAAAYRAMMRSAHDALYAHIAAGQKSGFVHADLDPDRTATWLMWMLERGLLQLVAPATPAARDRLLTAVSDIMWRTLYAREDA